jgi:alanyl-tRNA synthetase
MKSHNEIRNDFLDFFRGKNHKIVPSAPVIPHGDTTLLFTNAGMNQFKDIFLGTRKPENTRIADTQKCLRVSGKHNDLEEVGRDTYHQTFFEMLGNWSFGDYFKAEAIEWSWEFLVSVCGLPAERLWATYFGGYGQEGLEPDSEAAALWQQKSAIPPERILPFGKKDNFWEMGDIGPCGPCSEIHIDLGEEFCTMKEAPGHRCSVNGSCARFIELWNLVFIQFNRKKEGSLARLDMNHVDTGMGFERLVAVIQKTYSNYDTDIFAPLFHEISHITGFHYGGNSPEVDVAFRVVADHVRALCFAIADGAVPEKKGRGSVLRRLLRRAARFGRQVLKMEEPFIYRLPAVVAKVYDAIFPEIGARLDHIELIVNREESSFAETIERGLGRFHSLVASLPENTKVIDGYEAYRLYHQDGFPRDLIDQMAGEHALTIDEEGWNKAEEEHRERSKCETREELFDVHELQGLEPTVFIGYWEKGEAAHEGTAATAKALKILGGAKVLILDRTPFYAESGGQVGDTGFIEAPNFKFTVSDTQKSGDYYLHMGTLEKGDALALPSEVNTFVDYERRKKIMANHSATHLLHWALKKVLGPHADQQGSEVNPDYFRFDVAHHQAISPDEQKEIEYLVNEKICENIPLSMTVASLEEARRSGVTALFGEKYGEYVRVIDIGSFSRELCGGTHCRSTGDIGFFYLMAETSVEAGVRRIEAVTRMVSVTKIQDERRILKNLAGSLNTGIGEIPARVEALIAQVKELKKARTEDRKKDLPQYRPMLLEEAITIGKVKVLVKFLEDFPGDQLGDLADDLRNGSSAVCGLLVAGEKERLSILGFASKHLVESHDLHLGNLVKEISAQLGGGGGGRADFAKGTGCKRAELKEALLHAKNHLQKKLETEECNEV